MSEAIQGELDLPFDLADVDRLADAAAEAVRAWPKRMAELYDMFRADYARDYPAGDADRHARRSMVIVARLIGGRNVYFPQATMLEHALRDAEIYHRMGADSAEALADRFGVTRMRVYQIYAEQKALRRKRDQPSLFVE